MFFLYSGINLKKFLPSLKRENKKIIEAGVYGGQREFNDGMDMDRRPGMTAHGGRAGGNMPKVLRNAKHGRPRKSAAQCDMAHLDKLIAEATVDCYNESEEVTGIFTMLEENLAVPFTTTLLGVEVAVEQVDLNDADEIVAVCRRGRERLWVPVIDLPLPEPKPKGALWIDAYRRWAQER